MMLDHVRPRGAVDGHAKRCNHFAERIPEGAVILDRNGDTQLLVRKRRMLRIKGDTRRSKLKGRFQLPGLLLLRQRQQRLQCGWNARLQVGRLTARRTSGSG